MRQRTGPTGSAELAGGLWVWYVWESFGGPAGAGRAGLGRQIWQRVCLQVRVGDLVGRRQQSQALPPGRLSLSFQSQRNRSWSSAAALTCWRTDRARTTLGKAGGAIAGGLFGEEAALRFREPRGRGFGVVGSSGARKTRGGPEFPGEGRPPGCRRPPCNGEGRVVIGSRA